MQTYYGSPAVSRTRVIEPVAAGHPGTEPVAAVPRLLLLGADTPAVVDLDAKTHAFAAQPQGYPYNVAEICQLCPVA
jgi:hypothetical protein